MRVRIALIASISSMDSGTSWSLFRLAVELKKRGLYVLIILPKRGDIEEKLKKEKIEYYVAAQYNGDCWWIRKNTNRCNVKFWSRYLMKKVLNQIAQYKIESILRNKEINIVHMNTLTSYVGAKAALKLNINLVWHIRELLEEGLGIEFFNKEKSYALIKRATQIIAVSETAKIKYKDVFSNIKVIYNGVNVKSYFFDRKILQNNAVVIMIAGRIVEEKGQLELIQAINMMPHNIKNAICCYLVGGIESQKYYDEIVEYIKQNKLEEIIHYIGYTDNIRKYLQNTDILCSCSKKEAFGRTMVEGMIAGCLVIGANTGAAKEIITHGETGLIYEYGKADCLKNCIEYVFENRDTACRIASAGQENAKEKYTDEKNAEEIFKLYKNILNL